MQNIQAKLSGGVNVWVEHLADELDLRGLVRILLLELHHQSKSAILKGSVGGADDDGVPTAVDKYLSQVIDRVEAATYQVMTLSGTGDAETPAGGSVCMRCS